jgi:hypothetical protein
LRFELHYIRSQRESLWLRGQVRLTLQTALLIKVSLIPRRYAPGIIPLALRASFHSLSVSVINNFLLKLRNTTAGVYKQGILSALPVPHEHNRS